MRNLVLAMAIILALSIPAAAFDRNGYIAQGFNYSDLEIVQGDPVPLDTGGVAGKVNFVTTYLLRGVIENAENRFREHVQVRFTATDCSGSKTMWSIAVDVGSLEAFEKFAFLQLISYYPPGRPCHINAVGYGD